MAADDKKSRHERAAVAHAQQLVTNAGLMWREITGQDIGIDAILEWPFADGEEHSVRGFALVQVKSRSDAIAGEDVKVDFRERHHLYWLTQRLPVLLCVVETKDSGDFSTGVSGHWIDYKALRPHEYSVSQSPRKEWTLRVPRASPHVWSPEADDHVDWHGKANSFRSWLEGALVRPAEAMTITLCEAADNYLGAGKPDRAQSCLRQIPVWEEVLLGKDARRSVELLFAKAARRQGAVEEQQERLERIRAHGGVALEFLTYELALTHWTRACMTPFPKDDLNSWKKALEILDTPRFRGKPSFRELQKDLLSLGAFVNIRSTLSCLPGHLSDLPDVNTCSDLRTVIELWRESEEARASEPRFHLQLLNAQRALCRGHLARGEIIEAEKVLKDLNIDLTREPDREVLALTDFLLLEAWHSIEVGKKESAAATLTCTRQLLRAMRDPLLEWVQEVTAAKLNQMSAPRLSST